MSCIICLNEIYFICVLARKPGSPVVIAVDCGLPETHIPSSEPTTHRDKDHHGYAMVVHRTNAALLASQVGRYDVLACGDL